jgi:hypothetical protein
MQIHKSKTAKSSCYKIKKKKILKKSLTAGSKAKLHFLTAEVDQEE